ncbi:MAG TPA: diacylglycerol kinase family protein [Candidatus Limnocylindria bacterium]|nr:diacylglycerol kinase family protein [Candidatus Limnocylindria bacterium]
MFLNEGAGSARSDRVRRAVDLTRHALDADLHVTETRDPAELREWLSARIEGYATAVMAGGDGTLGVAYNVAADREGLSMGYIPAGFGNATAHLLRMPREPEAQAEVIRAGETRPVDLVAVDGRLALFAGAGWDALVSGRYAAAGAKRLPGWAVAVTRSVPDLWRRPEVEIRADGWAVHRGPMELMVVSTTPFYGRGLRVNPGARPDSGTLSLRVYPGPAPRLAIEAGRWALGMPPHARRIAALRIELRTRDGSDIPVQADGDLLGGRPAWDFEIRPRAVRLIGRWD